MKESPRIWPDVNICILQPNQLTPSETFLRAHAEKLPGSIQVLYGLRPRPAERGVTPGSRLRRLRTRIIARLGRLPRQWEITECLVHELRRASPTVVLAQYGPTGVRALDACRRLSIPLVVHFHGFDVNNYRTLDEYRDEYPRLFQESAAMVAVSHVMRDKLIAMGASPAKVHYNPCGADCEQFGQADPANSGPDFLTIGRFVENKAPHVAILAFAELHRRRPAARLHMIGEGPDLLFCRELARRLRLSDAVRFLGVQSHTAVRDHMRSVRAVLHPSIVATSGDAEGTPLAVMEAGASGLPVVATRIGGIPDVVLHERTGLLVEPRDVYQLAWQMQRLADDSQFAASLGAAARKRVRENFSQRQTVSRLASILQSVALPTDAYWARKARKLAA